MTTVKTNNSGISSTMVAVLLIVVIAGAFYMYRNHENRTTTINLPGDNHIEVTKPQ